MKDDDPIGGRMLSAEAGPSPAQMEGTGAVCRAREHQQADVLKWHLAFIIWDGGGATKFPCKISENADEGDGQASHNHPYGDQGDTEEKEGDPVNQGQPSHGGHGKETEDTAGASWGRHRSHLSR